MDASGGALNGTPDACNKAENLEQSRISAFVFVGCFHALSWFLPPAD
jgi:hypothetical protein